MYVVFRTRRSERPHAELVNVSIKYNYVYGLIFNLILIVHCDHFVNVRQVICI